MLSGNKGEWSEIYTLLKILADKQLYAGKSDLNKIENLIFPLIMVLREESNGTYSYSYEDDLVVIKGGKEEFKIPIFRFHENATFLLAKLQGNTSTTFSIPEVEEFINSFSCRSLKAKSSVKSDIRIVIHDQRTGMKPELGFSIKSQLGKPATLFNSSKASNFIFEIQDINLTVNEVTLVNGLKTRSKIQDRVKKIMTLGGTLVFQRTEGMVFFNNLTLIDSLLPKMLAELLLSFSCSPYNKLIDLVNELERNNPLNFDNSQNHNFYEYKIKRFLSDVALGMVAIKVWDGLLDSTGGYLVVKEDGEILCYHIYNRNEFEDYLLMNTKIINPSSSKYNFGEIYEENDRFYFKLNLQVRFIK